MGRIVEPSLRLLSPVCLSDYWSQAKEKKWKSFLYCKPLFSFSPHPSGELLLMGFENWHFLLPFLILLSQSAQVLFWLGFDWAAISFWVFFVNSIEVNIQPQKVFSHHQSDHHKSHAWATHSQGRRKDMNVFQIFRNIKVYKNRCRQVGCSVKSYPGNYKYKGSYKYVLLKLTWWWGQQWNYHNNSNNSSGIRWAFTIKFVQSIRGLGDQLPGDDPLVGTGSDDYQRKISVSLLGPFLRAAWKFLGLILK